MNNETTTSSAAPTGLMYGLYGAIAMIVCSLLGYCFSSMTIVDSAIGFSGLFVIPIITLRNATLYHRNILQGGCITTFKVFTISMLINFVLGVVAGCIMYVFATKVDTSYPNMLFEKTTEMYRGLPFPKDFLDKEMNNIKEACSPFGIFRSSINAHLMMGAIIGLITGLIMKKGKNPFLKSE
jgi:hypothetical protein